MTEMEAMIQAVTQGAITAAKAAVKAITEVAGVVEGNSGGDITGIGGAKTCWPSLKQPIFSWVVKDK